MSCCDRSVTRWAMVIVTMMMIMAAMHPTWHPVVVVHAFSALPAPRVVGTTQTRITTAVAAKKSTSTEDAMSSMTNMMQNMKSTLQGFDVQEIRDKLQEVTEKLQSFDIQETVSNVDFSDVGKNLVSIKDNVMAGEFGQRGEGYVVAQFSLIILIAVGVVPVVGGLLQVLCGPVLLVAGVIGMALSLNAMGPQLSVWAVPPETGDEIELFNTGLFGECRHPIYASLLAICVGLSITTDSPTRLLLTAVLYYVLDRKADYEEDELTKVFGEEAYEEYKEQVPTKFIPLTLIQNLPSFGNN